MADFLAAHPVAEDSPLNIELPDEETMEAHGEYEAYEVDMKP